MGWRDNLHLEGNGSFRGVEFLVKSADRSAGRRTVVHEFPGRDKPKIDDLGRAAGHMILEAYVLGDDYMADRNLLFDAFNTAGPGPLVHPYWGSLTVTVVGQIRIRETPDEGGMARFTLPVIEGGEDLAPTIEPDTESEVDEAADTAIGALGEDFEEGWTVTGVIEAVRDAAQALVDGVNGVVSTVNKAKGYVNAAMNIADDIGDAIQELADTAASLILLPGQLVDSIQEIVGDIMSAVSSVTDAWDSYFTDDESAGSVAGTPSTAPLGGTAATGSQRSEILMTTFRGQVAYGDDFASVTESTPQREAEAGNQSAMVALMRGIVTVETCRAAARMPFASYDQSVAVRDELANQLDTLASTADDVSYNALMELRAAITRHLTNASADLPRVIDYTPATTLPALVIAHNLYGDASKDTDIIDRNGIRNPCLIGGGQSIEVLSND